MLVQVWRCPTKEQRKDFRVWMHDYRWTHNQCVQLQKQHEEAKLKVPKLQELREHYVYTEYVSGARVPEIGPAAWSAAAARPWLAIQTPIWTGPPLPMAAALETASPAGIAIGVGR